MLSLLEACIPNRVGRGHHDDKTGDPCSPNGKPVSAKPNSRAGVGPAQRKPARLSARAEAELHTQAQGRAKRILKAIAGLPARLVPQKVKDAANRIKKRLVDVLKKRYGERGAGIIFKVAALSAPIPLPGSQPAAIVLSLIIAEGVRLFRRTKPAANDRPADMGKVKDAVATVQQAVRKAAAKEFGRADSATPATAPTPAAPPPPAPRQTFKLDSTLHPTAKAIMRKLAEGLKASAEKLTAEQRTHYMDSCQQVLRRMNPATLERLQRGAAGGATFSASHADILPDLASEYERAGNKHAADKIRSGNKAAVAGMFATFNGRTEGKLFLDGGFKAGYEQDRRRALGRSAMTHEIYAHEMSHAIDGPDGEISSSKEWQSAWKEELANKDKGTISAYAASNAEEGLAEFGRLIFTASPEKLAKVKEHYPACWKVWHARGLVESGRRNMAGAELQESDDVPRLTDIFRGRIDFGKLGHADLLASRPPVVREACVPNRSGRGHHDDHTGHPCSAGGNGAQPTNSRAGVEPPPPAPRPKAERPKEAKAARRFRDIARRRRVIRAVKNEGELARAIEGHNLPDSEPADVVHVFGPTGKPITDPQNIKNLLRVRESAIKELRSGKASEARKKELHAFLASHEVHFFEVKTMLTQAEGRVHMNARAQARKRRWERKFAATFHTVVFDDRRGKKHSGTRLYYARGIGNLAVKNMEPHQSFDSILGAAYS